MNEIVFKAIGHIESPFDEVEDVPKRVSDAMDVEGKLVVNEEYLESMQDMKAGEEYMVIFHLDKCKSFKQTVALRGDGPLTALFSTRAPCRPNPIGVSNIIIKRIDGNIITFDGVDMLNNTPILDIKKVF